MKLISRKKVLQTMRQRNTRGKLVPFSCVVCKLNFTTGEGGDRLVAKKAVIYYQKRKARKAIKHRIPNHEENGTINIMFLPSEEIRTIHVRLIEKFNGMTVYD